MVTVSTFAEAGVRGASLIVTDVGVTEVTTGVVGGLEAETGLVGARTAF